MSRKGKLIAGFTVALLIGVGGFAYFLSRPSPLRLAYQAVYLGQPEAEVVELMRSLPPNHQHDWNELGGVLSSVEWEGLHKGDRHHVRGTPEQVLNNPAVRAARENVAAEANNGAVVPLEIEMLPDRLVYLRKGEVIATGYSRSSNQETFSVLCDRNGRVIERSIMTFRDESPWMWQVREFLATLSPF